MLWHAILDQNIGCADVSVQKFVTSIAVRRLDERILQAFTVQKDSRR